MEQIKKQDPESDSPQTHVLGEVTSVLTVVQISVECCEFSRAELEITVGSQN